MTFARSERLSSPTGADLNLLSQPAVSAPIGVIQINHGLAEHAARYIRFATALSEAGFHVYAHDHRGHGHTTAPDARLGVFAATDGAAKVLMDVDAVHDLIMQRHPGLPVITFGHSMGGLIALNHTFQYPGRAAGVAVWNSNFSDGMLARIGRFLLKLERLRLGSDVPSRLGPKLTFDAWAKTIQNRRTDFDWLSRIEHEVDAYIADPLCGFDASVGMWLDLMQWVFAGADNSKLIKLPRALPFNLHGGGADPATDNGKAVANLHRHLETLGVRDLTTTITKDGRHECLNDVGYEEVTTNFITWARRIAKAVGQEPAVNP